MTQQLSKSQFIRLSPDEQENILKEMELEAQFLEMPEGDQEKVLQVMEATSSQDVGQIEAGARGFAQGISSGFSDEIIAGLSASGKQFVDMMANFPGPPSPREPSFEERFKKDVTKQRQRDLAAETNFPVTFGASDVAGAIAQTAIPVAGQIKRGVDVGKGVGRGILGIAKAAGLSGLTAAGKSESKLGSKELQSQVEQSGLTGAAVQAAVNAAGPVGRAVGKLAIKSPRITQAILSGGKSEFLKSGIDAARKELPAGQRIEALLNAATSPKSKLSKAAVKFLDVLGESLEKQGTAGLIQTHTDLLQDPKYRKFLNKFERNK